MIRKIVIIDSEKCNGCGACVSACHEGAIVMRNNKAVLLRDDYCDGLGSCLPACPANAISFEEREALPYDEKAVAANMTGKKLTPLNCACPGAKAHSLAPKDASASQGGKLAQWPVQIRLAPVTAPFFDGADILVAADCAAYAYGNFHYDFMAGKVTLIGCPKLDGTDYSEKLKDILVSNTIKSVTAVRMSVPCCGGLERAVEKAVAQSGKELALRIVTINPQGAIVT